MQSACCASHLEPVSYNQCCMEGVFQLGLVLMHLFFDDLIYVWPLVWSVRSMRSHSDSVGSVRELKARMLRLALVWWSAGLLGSHWERMRGGNVFTHMNLRHSLLKQTRNQTNQTNLTSTWRWCCDVCWCSCIAFQTKIWTWTRVIIGKLKLKP